MEEVSCRCGCGQSRPLLDRRGRPRQYLKGHSGSHFIKGKTPDECGENNPSWKGGRIITKQGYIKVLVKDRYVMEHRLVMEQVLGRKLLLTEDVHHKNGVKTDNRPENLEVMTRGTHTTHHWTGKKHSEETKMKMSKNSPKPFLGKKHSEEAKTKVRNAKLEYWAKKKMG